jgi:zinc transporter 1/2/3
MGLPAEVGLLVVREVVNQNSTVPLVVRRDSSTSCDTGNSYDGRMGLRISAIFVILFTACFGTIFPVFANRNTKFRIPGWVFFVAKFFGSGVIVATAFIHLLSPAEDALRNPCLTGPITGYDWVSGISLMTIFVLAFTELMAMRFGMFMHRRDESGEDGRGGGFRQPDTTLSVFDRPKGSDSPGEGDRGLAEGQTDISDPTADTSTGDDYAAQMTAIFILEFGVIFHSIFIGLTLAVSGAEFSTLYAVIVFHQTFEGLGLGSRLAVSPWPKSREWTPYVLGIAYSFSTPLAIAVGLGVRNTYPPGSQTTLIVNGIFDSISAGILIYTGLVELIAHEFMFSHSMRKAKLSVVLSAFGMMSLGAGLMALLGKWA